MSNKLCYYGNCPHQGAIKFMQRRCESATRLPIQAELAGKCGLTGGSCSANPVTHATLFTTAPEFLPCRDRAQDRSQIFRINIARMLLATLLPIEAIQLQLFNE
jgi:hypothetical protein